jgi:CHAT domain-containing protein
VLENVTVGHEECEQVRNFGSFLLPSISAVPWQDKPRLIISPHRILHSIPFHAMRFEDQWLIQRAAMSYIPNLTSLQVAHARSKSRRTLVLGVERFHVPGHPLDALPAAEAEAIDIKRLYESRGAPAALLLGSRGEGTVERLRSMDDDGTLRMFTCLHFATHCESVNDENPMESHFFLQDSMLDGLEIANFRLGADIVVLSACCSGLRAVAGRGLTELPGDELFGLQAAFFQAGARCVLATLWPVNSLAAQSLATNFHARLATDNSCDAERALQASICEYLAKAGKQTSKVHYWAPFFLSVFGRPVRSQEERLHG